MLVRSLRRNRAGNHTHLQEEHIQNWLRDSYPEETYTDPPNPDRRIKLLGIIKFMWDTWSILTELGWNVLVLIPE